MFGRFVLERREAVYRLGEVDPEECVDVYDLVKFVWSQAAKEMG